VTFDIVPNRARIGTENLSGDVRARLSAIQCNFSSPLLKAIVVWGSAISSIADDAGFVDVFSSWMP